MHENIEYGHEVHPIRISSSREISHQIRAVVVSILALMQSSFAILDQRAIQYSDLVTRGFEHKTISGVRIWYHPTQSLITPEWIHTLRHTFEHYPSHLLSTHVTQIVLESNLKNMKGGLVDGRAYSALDTLYLRYEMPNRRQKENALHHEIAHMLIAPEDTIYKDFKNYFALSKNAQDFWPTRITLSGNIYARENVNEDIAVTSEALFFDGGFHWRSRSALAHQKYSTLQAHYQSLGIKMRVGEYE